MTDSIALNDIVDVFAAIDHVYDAFANQPWWRGHGDDTWTLVPGVHRDTARGAAYESHIAVKFEQRALTRHEQCPAPGDKARWLFLMQHHRLNTRLLDWTEAPLTGLFFALVADEDLDKPGVLWALDAYRLNELQIGVSGILQPGQKDAHELIDLAYEPRAASDPRVLGLLTHEVDVRMMVQLSAMTIHGSPQPLEQRPNANEFLRKFTIPPGAKRTLRDRIARLGIRRRNLFPDLDHLATDLNDDRY